MKKTLLTLFATLLIIFSVSVDAQAQHRGGAKTPKYVFLFIGDGMSQAHISLTEAYLASQKGIIGNESFSFTGFPVTGLVTTFSANSYITCSSAAGTAIATGTKTNNGMLGVDPQGNRLNSFAYKLKEKGFKVGIMSSVSIDHATPGAFFAGSNSRSSYYDIASQLPASGFDFFGGGGFVNPDGEDKMQTNIYTLIEKGGYKVAKGIEEMKNIKSKDKVVLVQKDGKGSDLPYAIDREEGDLSLKQIVSAAIKHLYNDKGFFIMAEGGKIDWAAHSNDGKTAILEVLDLGEAVDVAYQFYLEHPDETLILVTADHDTGGITVGSQKGYVLKLSEIEEQKRSMAVDKANEEKYEEMNKKAFIGWTTTSHTGVAVPVYAIGAGSFNFTGKMDNTELSRKIFKSMKIEF
ncbi:MAG: alkaline phosphatase [Bacteroidales bacterium]